jgi:enoyl-[acyl-carrier protein] reductase II
MTGEGLREEIRELNPLLISFWSKLMLLSTYVKEQIEVVKEEKVPVVTTGAGNPGELIEDFAHQGILTIL